MTCCAKMDRINRRNRRQIQSECYNTSAPKHANAITFFNTIAASAAYQRCDVTKKNGLQTRYADEFRCGSESSLHELLSEHNTPADAAAATAARCGGFGACATGFAIPPCRCRPVDLQQLCEARGREHGHYGLKKRFLHGNVLDVQQNRTKGSAELAGLEPAASAQQGGCKNSDGGPKAKTIPLFRKTCVYIAIQIKSIFMTNSEFVTTGRAYLLLELSADRRLGAGEDDDADV